MAAFRIARELLAHRAAHEVACEVTLALTPSGLVIEAGTATDPQGFLELVRSQAVEVGGRCEPTPTGVRVTLPVRRPS